MNLNLSAPKNITWWVAVVVGVLGILARFVKLPFVTQHDFWFVVVGFVLLVLGTLLEGL